MSLQVGDWSSSSAGNDSAPMDANDVEGNTTSTVVMIVSASIPLLLVVGGVAYCYWKDRLYQTARRARQEAAAAAAANNTTDARNDEATKEVRLEQIRVWLYEATVIAHDESCQRCLNAKEEELQHLKPAAIEDTKPAAIALPSGSDHEDSEETKMSEEEEAKESEDNFAGVAYCMPTSYNDSDDCESDGASAKETSTDEVIRECAICFESFQVGERVAWSQYANCHHTFHSECIKEWMWQRPDCPLCRTAFLQYTNSDSPTPASHKKDHASGDEAVSSEENSKADEPQGPAPDDFCFCLSHGIVRIPDHSKMHKSDSNV